MELKKIAIIGAGGFGREVKLLIQNINKVKPSFSFIGFYDDGIEKDTMINDFPVLGKIEDLNKIQTELAVAIAIGDPRTKKRVVNSINNKNIWYPNLISPYAILPDEYNSYGQGNIICAGTILTCNIQLKDFVILNLMCTVGHDAVLESFSSCMPSVNISGEVTLREGVYIGTGAKIVNQLEIGEFTTVGAGAVVSKSLPSNCVAVGIPAKPIKFL